MKSPKSDQQIIEAIKKLPKVTDNRNKDKLFQRISSQTNKNKNKKLVPILSAIATVAILLALSPLIINTTYFNDEELSKSEMDSATPFLESSDEDIHSSLQDHGEESATNIDYDSYIIQAIEKGSKIIHGAIADEQMQYVIPISIVVSDNTEENLYYSNLGEYIKANEWGVGNYLLENTSFSIDEVEQTAVIKLPNDFSILSGAQASIFERMLITMFEPLQINNVILKLTKDQQVNLGPIGKIEEIQVPKINKASYKRIQTSTNHHFLVPSSLDDNSTIHEALGDMKISDQAFNVYQTIPNEVDFTVEIKNDQLTLRFKDDIHVVDDHQHMLMIEAILMTAKSYGFISVAFKNSPVKSIGEYTMSEPIRVPDAVNPIE